MQTDVAIIGGGLSGLALARHLENAGADYTVFEARDRFGGRIFTQNVSHVPIDLGPSWFWPGQHRMEHLVKELGLTAFAQYSSGGAVFENVDGRVESGMHFASMQGSWRLVGGTGRVINSLLASLPQDRLLTGRTASRITQSGEIGFTNGSVCNAKRIVLALPPRVAAAMAFDPALPKEAIEAMEVIPTWMAGHAKFFATYKEPFWRRQGLSGDGFSRRGPLAEIHDASQEGPDAPGALFGFLSMPAKQRHGQDEAIIKACLAQLGRMFGEVASNPLETAYKDWSTDPLTASFLDTTPPSHHPNYDMPAALRQLWEGQLLMCGTETAPDCGGFLEGALAAAQVCGEALMRQ